MNTFRYKAMFGIFVLLIVFSGLCSVAEQQPQRSSERVEVHSQHDFIRQRTATSHDQKFQIFFEDFADEQFPPEGWVNYVYGDSPVTWIRSTVNEGSAYHGWTSSTQTADSWLVTPEISIPDDGTVIYLSFFEQNSFMSWYTYHAVYVSTGSGDPEDEDFVEVQEFDGESSEFTTRYVDLSAYAGQDIHIAFVYQGSDGAAWYVDNISVYPVYDYNVSLTQVTPDAIINVGDSVYYHLIVKNEGANEDDYFFNFSNTWAVGVFEDMNDVPVEVPLTLLPNQSADVYLKVTVPHGTMPGVTNVTNIEVYGTGVAADLDITSTSVEIYFHETFPTQIPDDWAIYEMGDPTPPGINWHWSTSLFCARHAWTSPGVWANNWLVTPPISIMPDSKGTITLYIDSWGTTDLEEWYDYHGIWISEGSGDPNDGEFAEFVQIIPDPDASWEYLSFDMSHYYGKEIYMAFVYQGEDRDHWAIDNIMIVNDGFDPDDISLGMALNPNMTWTTSTEPEGLEEWYAQTDYVYYGMAAAQSGEITHNQSTSVHTNVTGPGQLSFYWAVSSEANWDWLSFFVNGELMDRISGEMDWHQMVFDLPEGDHLLTWSYIKDGSVSMYDDCGYLDYVRFTPSTADGPDAAIFPTDITYSPSDPMPGDTVYITAIVHNVGDMTINSGNAKFYYSIEPDSGHNLIESVPFQNIPAGGSHDITIAWETDANLDPRVYIITVDLTDIAPEDVNYDNNSAHIDLALPVELMFFTAHGFNNRVNIKWQTASEINNLGFNLYRLNARKVSRFISFMPVKINEALIPGQGNSSTPHLYSFTDHVKNQGRYIYILESVDINGVTEEYRTNLQWLF